MAIENGDIDPSVTDDAAEFDKNDSSTWDQESEPKGIKYSLPEGYVPVLDEND